MGSIKNMPDTDLDNDFVSNRLQAITDFYMGHSVSISYENLWSKNFTIRMLLIK